MTKRLTLFLCVCALLLGSVADALAQSGNAGQVNYLAYAQSSFDPYTDSPTAAQEQWMRQNFSEMVVWSPYFDSKTTWFPNAYVYDDLYAIYNGSALQSEHPEYIMHDQWGNWLYIPFTCSNGSCPEWAGDISNPNFREWWVDNAWAMIQNGQYPGIFVDDVNMNFNVSYGDGSAADPIDYNTGQPMTYAAWRSYVAQFTQMIQQRLPGIKIIHNAIWYAGPSVGDWNSDPSIEAELNAATTVNIERGIASDTGLTGGTGTWSVYNEFSYVDYLHSIGKGVMWEEYSVTPTQQLYGLAGYFLTSNGQDFISDQTTNPENWFNGYSVNLGTPLGARTYNNGIYERQFSNGTVVLAEPGLGSTTVSLPTWLQDLNGNWANSVTLSGSEGAVFIGANTTENPAAIAGSTGVTRYLSDIAPVYSVNGWGPLQVNLSTGKTPLTIGGVTYAHGLGLNAYSEQHWNLWGSCSTFTGTVGVDGDVPSWLGHVDFQIWADGHLLYDSGFMQGSSPAENFSVNLAGYQQLGLVTTSGVWMGTNQYDDNGDWVNPVIVCQH